MRSTVPLTMQTTVPLSTYKIHLSQIIKKKRRTRALDNPSDVISSQFYGQLRDLGTEQDFCYGFGVMLVSKMRTFTEEQQNRFGTQTFEHLKVCRENQTS